MSILGKLMFWKKKDEFSDIGLGDKENLAFGNDFGQPGLDQGLGQAPTQPTPGLPPTPSVPSQPALPPTQFQAPRYETPQQDMNSKNLEIISSKLDALRASIDSLNQRLANIETIARGEEEKRGRRYY